MKMNTDFNKMMAVMTDEQLAELLTENKSEYQSEAVLAAEQEFKKRNLNLIDFKFNKTAQQSKPEENLKQFEWYHKALVILSPAFITLIFFVIERYVLGFALGRATPLILIILIQILIYNKLKSDGESLIAAKFLKWVTYSYYI